MNSGQQTTMRLSEAIRLGAMLGSQVRGTFFRRRGGEVATCALGAAAEALGVKEDGFCVPFAMWPILRVVVRERELPAVLQRASRPRPYQTLDWVIMELNDRARWTRTQIADWVQEFESRHMADCVPEQAVEPEPDRVAVDEPDDELLELCCSR